MDEQPTHPAALDGATVLQLAVPAIRLELTPERIQRRQRLETRLVCSLIFAACFSMLALGRWMTPEAKGYGTHAVWLHLPPCGFLATTGYPCPTCGCTTAVTYLAHGQPLNAIVTQPFGALVGLVALLLLPLCLVGIITGKWRGPQPFWLSYHFNRIIIGLALFTLASWLFKAGRMHQWW